VLYNVPHTSQLFYYVSLCLGSGALQLKRGMPTARIPLGNGNFFTFVEDCIIVFDGYLLKRITLQAVFLTFVRVVGTTQLSCSAYDVLP